MRNLLIILFVMVFCVVVMAENPPMEIRGFKGLNTRSGDFSLKPNEARVAHNIDFGRNLGSITKRYGYDSVSAIAGMDSIVDGSLYAAYFSDGRQRLFFIGDSSGVGYGNIYATSFGSANISGDSSSRLRQFWSVQNPTSFSQYQNDVYIVNGSHRGAVYDFNSGTIREFPLRAPGEPKVIPLNHTGGELNGEYRYTVEINMASNPYVSLGVINGHNLSTLSAPVKVQNGRVLLTGFNYMRPDSLASLTNTEAYKMSVQTAENNTEYWVTVNNDSVNYTSDASATSEEIATGLMNAINADSPGMADSVTADDIALFAGDFRIYDDLAQHNLTVKAHDSVYVTQSSGVYMSILRSMANPGDIDDKDSITRSVVYTRVRIRDSTILDTLTIIDSIPDTAYGYTIFDNDKYGRDSLGELDYGIYGQPGYVSGDTVGDTSAYGVYQGWNVKQSRYTGQVYVCTFVDTITGFESDTGRALFVYRDTISNMDSSVQQYTLSLPKVPTGETGLKVRLYRAPLIRIERDTTWSTYKFTIAQDDPACISYICLADGRCMWVQGNWGVGANYIQTFHSSGQWDVPDFITIADTSVIVSSEVSCSGLADIKTESTVHTKWSLDSLIMGSFRLIGEYASTVTNASDSMRFDSLENNPILFPILNPTRKSSPTLLKSLFSFQGRMFGVSNSRLYFSNLDAEVIDQSIYDWGEFQYIPINENDGDIITGVYPTQGAIRVFKNRSSYNVSELDGGFLGYEIDNSFWVGREITGTFGIVAPKSLQAGFGGYYYLSENGLIFETSSDNLSRRFNVSLLSSGLKNFEDLSSTTMANAQSFYLPKEQKYFLSMNDSTFVYDGQAGEWATWSMPFSGAALYGAENTAKFLPGDTMYFTKPGMSGLYRYGSTEFDVLDTVRWEWKGGPLFIDRNYYQVVGVGVWETSSDTNSNALVCWDYDENNVLNDSIFFPYLDSTRYRIKTFGPSADARAHVLRFGTSSNRILNKTVIDGIDLYYQKSGVTQEQ